MPDLDDREKRASSLSISLYPAGGGITNNATQDQEWRQEAGYGYPGILAGAPSTIVHRVGWGGGYMRQS